MRVPPDAGAPPLMRSYSLSDVPDERGYRISVKREGAASRYLHDHVKVGDVLDAAAPRGSFVLRDGTRPVVLISGGVGATPVLAMLHALAGEHSARPVWWLHGARNGDEHAFGAEVDALLGALADGHRAGRLQPAPAPTRPGTATTSLADSTSTLLERAEVPKDADYYLCGPEEFMRAIGAALTARGVAPERVATEAFGAVAVHASGLVKAGDRSPQPPDGPPGTGPTVTFTRSNVAIPWDDRYPSLLDFAEACDVPVGFGCRQGVCHNCESGVVEGAVTYDVEPLEPPPDGRVLVCCSRPASELALDLNPGASGETAPPPGGDLHLKGQTTRTSRSRSVMLGIDDGFAPSARGGTSSPEAGRGGMVRRPRGVPRFVEDYSSDIGCPPRRRCLLRPARSSLLRCFR